MSGAGDGPVNLNRARKQKVRADKKARADENAVRFGRSGAEKARARAEQDAQLRRIDGHRIERDTPER